MRRNELSAFSLAALLLVCPACRKEDPEPPVPTPDKGLLRVSVERAGDASLSAFVYGKEGSLAVGKEEPAGTSPWTWSEQLPEGEYTLWVVGSDPDEVRLAGTDDFASAYAEALPDGNTGLLRSLNSPLYVESLTGVKVENGKETSISSLPKDIRRILRLSINAGKGFSGAKVAGKLAGIASSIRLSGRLGMEPGVLQLEFLPSQAVGPGVYQATAGILGTSPVDGSGEGNLCTLSFETSSGERFSYQENLTQPLAQAIASGRDTLDLSLEVSPAIPIRLYTGIQTRAAVDAFDSTPVSIAVGTSTGDYPEHWTATATGGDITLNPERYYPTDGSTLFIRSYYPSVPHVNGEVHYDLTGQEDLMMTDEQRGSLTQRFDATATPLIHKHLLTQLSFKLVIANAPDNYRVRAVALNGLATSAKVSLSEGKVIPTGDPTSLAIYTASGTGGIPLAGGTADIPGFILVQPEATFTIDLILAVDDNPANDLVLNNVPVTIDGGGGESGNAYQIEVSLDLPDNPLEPDDPYVPDEPDPMEAYKVRIKATVIPWKQGNSGSADL